MTLIQNISIGKKVAASDYGISPIINWRIEHLETFTESWTVLVQKTLNQLIKFTVSFPGYAGELSTCHGQLNGLKMFLG